MLTPKRRSRSQASTRISATQKRLAIPCRRRCRRVLETLWQHTSPTLLIRMPGPRPPGTPVVVCRADLPCAHRSLLTRVLSQGGFARGCSQHGITRKSQYETSTRTPQPACLRRTVRGNSIYIYIYIYIHIHIYMYIYIYIYMFVCVCVRACVCVCVCVFVCAYHM